MFFTVFYNLWIVRLLERLNFLLDFPLDFLLFLPPLDEATLAIAASS